MSQTLNELNESEEKLLEIMEKVKNLLEIFMKNCNQLHQDSEKKVTNEEIMNLGLDIGQNISNFSKKMVKIVDESLPIEIPKMNKEKNLENMSCLNEKYLLNQLIVNFEQEISNKSDFFKEKL